jgi:hypothetical protein
VEATLVHWLPAALGVAGVLFGLLCYRELRRWARLIQRGEFVIAHKRRVQMRATLVECVEWIRMLGPQEAANGRVIYRNGHVSIALLRPTKPIVETVKPRPWTPLVDRVRARRARRAAPA